MSISASKQRDRGYHSLGDYSPPDSPGGMFSPLPSPHSFPVRSGGFEQVGDRREADSQPKDVKRNVHLPIPYSSYRSDSVDMRNTTPSLSPSDIILSPTILPRNSTTFFNNWPHAKPLPTPAQIRSSAFDSTFQILHQREHGSYAQRILHIPDLNLVIKHGPRTTIAEGQTLWVDRDDTFIYLSYIDGVSLDSRLNTLSDTELEHIAVQVAPMIASIRRLRQPLQDTFIGSPDRSAIRDQMWWGGYDAPPTDPFLSVKAFNDALFALAGHLPQFPHHEFFQNFRSSFSDTASIRFTHTDLATTNIIISRTSTEVLGIIDWQESGWYPEHWEYLKAKHTAPPRWYDYVDIALQSQYEPNTIGKKIQAVGAPQFGFKIEVEHAFDWRKTRSANTISLFLLGTTDASNVVDITESTKTTDLNKNDKFEKVVAKLNAPPAASSEVMPTGTVSEVAAALQHDIPGMRRCQEWTMEYIAALVKAGLLPDEAMNVVAEARKLNPFPPTD
ncbi:hypothetical protein D9615_001001 [Tricholomella constricta]|uniref:Aminoglycoside phosphotransferase domain-containing protein n=1 Tax=Tricholomella constricta TaxID=117010 RepID=A0A8H5HKJ5_9AGAR|nr:hypothetical protein D9615_001001 [Tricholomella constricta]